MQRAEEDNYLNTLMDTFSYSILLDREARIRKYSDSLLPLMGITDGASFIGKSLFDVYLLLGDKYAKEASARLSRIVSGGENEVVEDATIEWPSGMKRIYRIVYRRARKGDPDDIIVMARDITDIHLDIAEHRAREWLNTADTPCMVWDENGKIVMYNKGSVDVFGITDGLPADEVNVLFLSVQPQYQPDQRLTEDVRLGLIEEALHDGFSQATVQLSDLSGNAIFFMVNVARSSWLFDYRLIVYFKNLTDSMLREAAFREALLHKEAAELASEAKSKFLATVSHEIRTPMNAVIGLSELLLREKLDDRQRGYANDINKSAIALMHIINDILDVSKIQAGKFSLDPVHYDFNMLIDNIVSVFNVLLEDKDVVFSLEMERQPGLFLFGDDMRLRQVLLNVIGNAVKFTEKGHIQLAVGLTDNDIKIAVSDTGPGIPEESIPTLFEAFEQADMPGNRSVTGTGLGLTISKSLVDMMGGQITVESVYGEGSVFYIDIPKVAGDESLVLRNEDKEIMFSAPDARVLVVDDNKTNLIVASDLLQLYDITAETVASGKQAIELVQRKDYDIVFMDHRMPEMSGTETTKRIRELGLPVTIVALTASVITNAREKMLAAGMDDYLSKPIVKAELTRMLKKWIPAEKIREALPESYGWCASADDENGEFWNKIEKIGGLDFQTGLGRVDGRLEIYKKTLKLMLREIEKCDINLTGFISAGDLKNFGIVVHGMKGLLASIGAMKLSAEAKDLETAADDHDNGFCESNLPGFLEELGELYNAVKEAFSASGNNEAAFEIPAELPIILEKLMAAIEDFDFLSIDREIENISALSLRGGLKDVVEQLKDTVMMMDYAAAAGHIKRLLADILRH